MILIGLGANLPRDAGSPRETLEAALRRLADRGVPVLARSSWYSTAPQPPSDQPRYVNGVASVATTLEPPALLRLLHEIEAELGRRRGVRNAARTVDLDLLDHDGRICRDPQLILPHPRLAERAFVLLPLADVAPGWRHPETGLTVESLIAALPPDQDVQRLSP